LRDRHYNFIYIDFCDQICSMPSSSSLAPSNCLPLALLSAKDSPRAEDAEDTEDAPPMSVPLVGMVFVVPSPVGADDADGGEEVEDGVLI
jgi:hypothetical protein